MQAAATAMSAAVNFAPGDSQANPDFLAAIIRASASYSIVASQDIVDVRGLKLWAKGLPVSAALQQRLLERKLLNPIEACLMAEDGVTHFSLMESVLILAVLAHAVGQCIAMQDQTKHSAEDLLALVDSNIETGNQEMIQQLLGTTRGSA